MDSGQKMRPGNASKVANIEDYTWKDKNGMRKRKNHYEEPMSIYEVHMGSWKKDFVG